jgi:hypothetical protein
MATTARRPTSAAGAGPPRLLDLELPATDPKGGQASIYKERFVNKRAEWFRTLGELFERGEIDLDPDDDRLAAQLRGSSGS